MKCKSNLIFFLICLSLLLNFACVSQDSPVKADSKKETATTQNTEQKESKVVTPKKEEAKTEKSPKSTVPTAGTVFFSESKISAKLGEKITVNIRVHSGDQKVAAYGFDVEYDANSLELLKDKGTEGFEAGPEGFISVANTKTPGKATIAGFDVMGKGPGFNLDFLSFDLKCKAKAMAKCTISVKNLADDQTKDIGTPRGSELEINIQ